MGMICGLEYGEKGFFFYVSVGRVWIQMSVVGL
jgi:hypothetical protein